MPDDDTADPSAGRGRRVAAGLALSVVVASLLALGIWQVQRLHWKTKLIATVQARISAPAVPVPAPAQWSPLAATDDAYRHVSARGTLLPPVTFVQASTELGSGFWAMTPLRLEGGGIVFINRGFVADDAKAEFARRDATAKQPDPATTITGLLRPSEPRGGFLRSNDPTAGRWYSRDTLAMGRADGLTTVAPFFIDADAQPGADPDQPPVAGLTVVSFPNNHLIYAITWFTMAAMLAGTSVYLLVVRPQA